MLLSNFLFKLQIERLALQGKQFKIIGIDLGTKFTGLSISDEQLKNVYFLNHHISQILSIDDTSLYRKIVRYSNNNGVAGIVIGQPSDNIKLQNQNMNSYCEQFAQNLTKWTYNKQIILTLTNEDCTTSAANHIAAKAYNMKNDKKMVDSIAAMLILEGFLQKLTIPIKEDQNQYR